MSSSLASPDARRLRGLLLASAGAIAFSGKAILAKLLYRHGLDPWSVVGMRMAMAFPLFAVMAWRAGRVSAAEGGMPWRQLCVLGVLGYYLASTLDFLGLHYISAGLERAILYLNPTLVLLIGVWRHGTRLRGAQVAALSVSYAGLAMVWWHDWQQLPDTAGWALLVGSLLVFGSALSYAIYLIGSGQLVQRLGSMRLVGWASCVACVLCVGQWAVVHAATGGHAGALQAWPAEVWALSAINAVFCTVVPVWLVMRGVQLLGASVAAQVGMIGPLSTVWMASVWLDEPLGPALLAGTALVLAGIVWLGRQRPA